MRRRTMLVLGVGGAALIAPGMAAAAAGATDQGFVAKAAQANLAEIAAGRTALGKAQSPEVKRFAQRMVHDHQSALAKLGLAVGGLDISLPKKPSAAQRSGLAGLNKLSGSTFDTAYLHNQVAVHMATLQLLKTESSGGDEAQLKTYAKAQTPIVSTHLKMARRMVEGIG